MNIFQAWQDTKATTKTKAAAIKRHQKGTGGGPPCDVIMSDVQNDVLPLLSQVAVGGHSNSTESVVKFTFDDVTPKKTSQSLSREMVENTGKLLLPKVFNDLGRKLTI